MPVYSVEANSFDIARNAVLVDTNVLVAAFDPDDPDHDDALIFLEEFDHQWLIPAAVVIETWGVLVGKNGYRQGGYHFLAWLNTPGRTIIVLPQQGEFSREREIIEAWHVDCVDAVIGNLSHNISTQCLMVPPVATYDARDFYKLRGNVQLRVNLIDMRTGIHQDLD